MNHNSTIYVPGHTGLVGSAIVRNLESKGFKHILKIPSKELDLRDSKKTDTIFELYKPEYIFLAAAKVGGIGANASQKAEFIYDNLMIQTNIIHNAYKHDCKKLLFLGSSCIYPKHSTIPIKEEYLMTGPLEPTNDAYAIAKIAGIKMCQSYSEQYGFNAISLMPTNLYGINDNFDTQTSHVLPALINKFHKAKINNEKTITLWGDGSALREFLYADDLAEACVMCMEKYNDRNIINVGSGVEFSIKELSEIIKNIIGYEGNILWDTTKPNGTHSKYLDNTKIENLGWSPNTTLDTGIKKVYKWFKENIIQ